MAGGWGICDPKLAACFLAVSTQRDASFSAFIRVATSSSSDAM